MDAGGMSVVIGAGGGIGSALIERLEALSPPHAVLGLSRHSTPRLDLLDEDSIEAAAAHVARRAAELGLRLRLVITATGMLHDGARQPERSLREIDAGHLAASFAINAIGPALLMKHFLPLLPREGRSVFATLSARVGSIGDNALGGWYGYRASKAALNQLTRTAAIEIARRKPEAICVALHPGTVATGLSAPFAKSGLDVRPTAAAARDLLAVIEGLQATDTGSFRDQNGQVIAW